MTDRENICMIIFGGTGSLAHRKLVPAIYEMQQVGQLPIGFTVLGVGRKNKSSAQYRQELAASVEEYSASPFEKELWEKTASGLHYHAMDVEDSSAYQGLKDTIDKLSASHTKAQNIIYYLALAPRLFDSVAANLKQHGLNNSSDGWRRIIIEKPFGNNLASAAALNEALTGTFNERDIYRIDHYLGKEMLQNILVIRFANCIFEPLWKNRYIDNIQITASEDSGIGERGHYYDLSGAMRDMVQSHLFQMLALTSLEPPSHVDVDSLYQEKLRLLEKISIWPEGSTKDNVVFGQYAGYRDEPDVSSASQTETFTFLKLAIDNERWRGVPFYLRTGKMLDEKIAKIVIQFKVPLQISSHLLPEGSLADKRFLPNLLTLKVQPREGVVFQFNIKKPATMAEIVPVDMDFCQPCAFLINTPEAYERLLADAMAGDKTRFSSWKEIECSWSIIDSIYKDYRLEGGCLHPYQPGSRGPEAVSSILDRDKRNWWR